MTAAPVHVSTTCFESRDIDEIVAACAAAGIDALELSTVDRFELARLDAPDVPRHLLVHNYFGADDPPFVLNLASRDPELLGRSLAHCRAALDLSARLGGSVYAAHAGYTADLDPRLLGDPAAQALLRVDELAPAEEAYATLLASVRELAAHGRSLGVRFLVENHVLPAAAGETGRRLLQMVEPRELVRLADDVADPAFGLLLDVGHLRVSAATLGFDASAALDALAPWVAALHLSDNDGTADAHEPFGPDAWFAPRLQAFRDAVVTVELAPTAPDRLLAVRDTVTACLRAAHSSS